MVCKLIDGAFTVVSIDNLDKLFSKTVVRTGDVSRCWNGTTVNGYNPKPHSLKENVFSDVRTVLSDTSEHSYSKDQTRQYGPVQPESAAVIHSESDHAYSAKEKSVDATEVPQKRSYARTMREAGRTSKLTLEKHMPVIIKQCAPSLHKYSPSFTTPSEEETKAWGEFFSNVFWYVSERQACEDNMTVPGIKCKFYIDNTWKHHNSTEKSNIVYLSVLNAHADTVETVKYVLDQLYRDLLMKKRLNHLVVVGDAKTYDHLSIW